MEDLQLFGEAVGLLGVALLLMYADWTSHAPDQGSKDHIASRWWYWTGAFAGILGPLFLLLLGAAKPLGLFT